MRLEEPTSWKQALSTAITWIGEVVILLSFIFAVVFFALTFVYYCLNDNIGAVKSMIMYIFFCYVNEKFSGR